MSVIENLSKPEYVFRPSQIVRRLRHAWQTPAAGGFVSVELPWKLPLRVVPTETIGRLVWTFGVFELIVTEALWRLTDAGETALDVGGNIGYMTSILASRVGPAGKVHVFEPHPVLFAELETNIRSWKGRRPMPAIEAHRLALSDSRGTAELAMGDSFDGNRGLGSVDLDGAAGGPRVPVTLERLDSLLPAEARIGMAKVDVEGHEEQVLRGAGEMLAQRRIRDVLFEEHRQYPTPVTRLLEEAGYTVFALRHTFWGPELIDPGAAGPPLRVWDTQNYLATADPERARSRFRRRGWGSLRNSAAPLP